MQITKLDSHVRKSQQAMPQDQSFVALQLAAFQTLPAFHQSSAVDVHPHYPAVPSSVPRTIQHLDPLSACENDPVAANVSHNTPVQLCHKDPEPQPRQQLSDPEITPPAGKQKAGSHEEVQDGWQAHERRLAALEASLLERASMASKTLSHAAGSIRQVSHPIKSLINRMCSMLDACPIHMHSVMRTRGGGSNTAHELQYNHNHAIPCCRNVPMLRHNHLHLPR